MMDGWLSFFTSWVYSTDSDIPRIVPLAIFLCILFFLEAIYFFLRQLRDPSENRIKERLKFVQSMESGQPAKSLFKEELFDKESWKQNLLRKLNKLFNLDELLLQADVPWRASTVFLVCFIIGAMTGFYGFFQFGILGAVGGFIGVSYFLPYFLLILKKKRRLRQFEKQLPEALGLMARSLKAGHSFPSSMQLVADEMANPIGIEFFKTSKEYNYGLDFNEVMMNLYTRNQLPDLKFFLTAILIQRETGGNLVEILEKIAHLIRERFKLVNQIKALTAEGRLSGLILILLPVIIAFLLWRINPSYISMLWTHPTGQMMAGFAGFLQMLGILAIKKIVNIKV